MLVSILAGLGYVVMMVITGILIIKANANLIDYEVVVVLFAAIWPIVLPMTLVYLTIKIIIELL